MSEPDHIVLEAVAYTDDADIEYTESGRIANHDELVNKGKTYYEARAVSPDVPAMVNDAMLVYPNDDDWRDEYDDMEIGDTLRLT